MSCNKPVDPAASSAAPIRVAAAADLAFAFEDVGRAFEKKTGQKVVFSFGSTGLLAKQISEGAPYDAFAAANMSFIDDVVKSGACLGDTKSLYAIGRIALWGKKGSGVPKSVDELSQPRFAKIAMANPDHAPYGLAAKQAMTKSGVWNAVSSKMVYGENVQQTLQFAESGNAEVAIVALSLAVVTEEGEYALVDSTLHDPLEQALVVCKGSAASGGSMQPAARDFTRFVGSEPGRAIMRRYGFLLPGEGVPAREPK